MKYLPILSLFLLFRSCDVGSVNYAVKDIRIDKKVKTIIAGKPAIHLTITNYGRNLVKGITITTKAKRNQNDIDISIVKIPFLQAEETVEVSSILNRLTTHNDYDLLTFSLVYLE